jgi:hypothetical protein
MPQQGIKCIASYRQLRHLILSVVRHTRKSQRTNSTFGFCRHESQHLKNQKSCFFANARMTKFEKKIYNIENANSYNDKCPKG